MSCPAFEGDTDRSGSLAGSGVTGAVVELESAVISTGVTSTGVKSILLSNSAFSTAAGCTVVGSDFEAANPNPLFPPPRFLKPSDHPDFFFGNDATSGSTFVAVTLEEEA